MMNFRLVVSRGLAAAVVLAGSGVLSVAQAAASQCPGSYADGQRPDIVSVALARHTTELCSSAYAVFYSGIARAPLWSAEHLSPGRVEAAKGVPRSNVFMEDIRLPREWRADLSDFRHSGFDRGHLSPAGDMPSPAADAESFLLSNIVAQDPKLNRTLWSAIEQAVRALARHREIYVITGALWKGQDITWLGRRVMVPTHLYKLIYDPENEAAAAYLVENAPNKAHTPVSLEELSALAGIDFFPGKHLRRLKLPRPRY